MRRWLSPVRALAVALTVGALVAPLTSAPAAPAVVYKELKAPAPSWYTAELHARVLAAGDKGVPVPASVDIPASSLAFFGIRPGQLIIVAGGTLCTSNFVFRSGSSYAIGTAGHCGNVGDQVTMLFLPKGLVNIGTITKSTGDAGVGNDFALISIKSSLNYFVSPSMPYWGGPTQPYSTPSKIPLIVKHAGWGLGIGTGGTPRIGIGSAYNHTGAWRFISAINLGDSGSGALAGNGQAVGNITHISLSIGGPRLIANAAGTSIGRILQIANMPLWTCTRVWPLFGCPTGLL